MPAAFSFNPPGDAVALAHRLAEAGHQVFFCGGAVRDSLRGEQPKDYDLATSATPEEISRLIPSAIPVGKAFGVMLAEGTAGGHYEIATFRTDLAYTDGRHPDGVVFSTPEEDARRRDFTINALFYNLFTREIIDYVGGLADLEGRTLRTVGVATERFQEDKLRLLRAVRFAARTGFRIAEETWDALCLLAGEIKVVSAERIAGELETILTNGYASPGLRLLRESGLLPHLLPEVEALAGVLQPPLFHPEGDVWTHTLILLAYLDQAVKNQVGPEDFTPADLEQRIPPPPSPPGEKPGADSASLPMGREEYLEGIRECWSAMDSGARLALAWSALLHDIGKPDTFEVSDRIRFNNHDLQGAEMARDILIRLHRSVRLQESVYSLIRRHIHFSNLSHLRRNKLRRWLAEADFPLHLELHRLDCHSSHNLLANWFFGLRAWRLEKERPAARKPLLRGGDLLDLGVRPGPEIGRLLRLVEDAQLDGEISSRAEALALVERERAGESVQGEKKDSHPAKI
ncbi:MAG: HDIG domain-containing protein [Planctomycetota bacterium]|jgi:poly(A) polymerase|nr:HDIG domain-containing protein [Planctomycetota bacterium]